MQGSCGQLAILSLFVRPPFCFPACHSNTVEMLIENREGNTFKKISKVQKSKTQERKVKMEEGELKPGGLQPKGQDMKDGGELQPGSDSQKPGSGKSELIDYPHGKKEIKDSQEDRSSPTRGLVLFVSILPVLFICPPYPSAPLLQRHHT